MKVRDRRMNDPEYMADLRQRFFIRNPRMADEEVYALCGDTFNASLVELELAQRRLRRELRKTALYRTAVWIVSWVGKGVRRLIR